MMIYSQQLLRRKLKQMPSPSCMPITIMMVLLLGIVVALMPSVITGINIDIPSLNTEPLEIYDDFTYTTVYVADNYTTVIDDNIINIADVGEAVKSLHKNKEVDDIKVFVRADKNVGYDAVVRTLESLNDKGFKDISLVGKYSGEKKY